MMHECPRCGFIQPKDRYCANCGLDIDHYKPAPKPFFRRVFESTAFQVSLAIMIVLGLGSWIYLTQRQAIEEKLSAALNRSTPNTATGPDIESATPNVSDTTATSEQISPDIASNPANTTATPPSVPSAATNSKTLEAGDIRGTVGAKELNIQFVEMSRLFLQQLAQEHQVVDETAATRSIVLASQPNVTSWQERDPQLNTLPRGDTHSVRAGREIPLDFTHMAGGPNDVIGLNLVIVPGAITQQTIEFSVNGTVSLRTPEGSVGNYGFEGRYTLPNTSTLLIAGVVPHQPIRAEDQENFSNTPLVILGSPEFINNTSELVMVIQPK